MLHVQCAFLHNRERERARVPLFEQLGSEATLWGRSGITYHIFHKRFRLVLHTPKSHKYSKSYDPLEMEWKKIHMLPMLKHKSCFIAPPFRIATTDLP